MADRGFDEFWTRYPRKVGKVAALREWRRIKPDDELVKQMLDTLEWQIDEWADNDRQFTPHPRTWLHQGRWDDEPMQAIEKRRAPTFSEMKARRWVG